ncbi:hypothetical protein PV372_27650, partial [Streptomyces scabiei]|nr:hypothetical protein [Streptomyces scabiei]
MKDTPGWASPGSAPSGGQEPDPQGSARPEDRTDADRAQPADQAGPDQAPQQSKWSKVHHPQTTMPLYTCVSHFVLTKKKQRTK